VREPVARQVHRVGRKGVLGRKPAAVHAASHPVAGFSTVRAIAPVAGAMFGGGGCSGPIAAWGAHGDPDDTVAYANGLSAIERVMDVDGCDPNSGTPVEPSEFCTAYQCDVGYPVIWCVHNENHNWPEFAAESIKAFFDSF